MNLSHYFEKLLFTPFSAFFRVASCADSPLMSLAAVKGPATIHWRVAAYSSMSFEATLKPAKKFIKNHFFQIAGGSWLFPP